jgi:HAMP domain-containing protein
LSAGLRQKLLYALVAIALAMVGAMYIVSETTVRRMLTDKLSRQAVVIGRQLASGSESGILTREQVLLSLRLRELVREGEGVAYAYLLDPQSAVIAHSFENGFPAGLAAANPLAEGASESIRPVRTGEGDILDVAVPILGGKLGTAHVGMSGKIVERDVDEILRTVLLVTGGIIGAMALALAFIGTAATKPIVELAGLARKVGEGRWDARATVRSGDEVGQLAIAFNGMIEARRAHDLDRERLVSELKEALDNVQTLSGFLPICASCKKIRNDEGYWQQVESYLSRHTGVLFSHGICPECLTQARAELDKNARREAQDSNR